MIRGHISIIYLGCDGIFFSIIMAPVYLIIKLTVPVIDDEDESWNYPLTIIQSLAAPFMFYVLLEQYEEDEFGVDDNCGLDPTSDCDGFPRWAIPIIIGAFFCLSKSVQHLGWIRLKLDFEVKVPNVQRR